MPIADFKTLCIGYATSPGAKCISFPGGVELCANIPSVIPATSVEVVLELLNKLNSALAPLQPVFNIIDAVLAVFDCIKAISTLDPVEIVNCIPNLAERINALLSLIPQLSLPILIRDAIDCLIVYIEGTIAQINRMRDYLDLIIEAQTLTATTDIEIGPIIDCATGNLDQLLVFMGEQTEPVNRVIGIINAFLQLLGLPCCPSLSTPSLDDGFITLLEGLVEFLQFLRDLITIPIPTPQLGVSEDDC